MYQKYFYISLFLMAGSLFAQSKGITSFEENGLYGFKNKKGKVIIEPQYEQTMEFTKSGVGFVVSKNKWICIDTKNKFLLESFLYDNGPDYIVESLARYVVEGKMGFHNERCQKVIEAQYDFAYPFENGYAIVCNGCELKPEGEHKRIVGGKYGVIDKKGNLVIPIDYEAIISVDAKKRIAEVKQDGKTVKVKWKARS
ncbi:WG repeat-containing protein [Leptospira levettii]|uniref:WG repeat-containing protein n=1 Tax=Leptospira levettii TaxID=2023178 RepID=A0AAW5V7I8_9LEPT|nr:WG repeat-containing protein [Leptospira levettii]MCW7465737.1 WG repeat-containing protein [Leptospira levettii]MCW7510475.1 WG repeat-containing protein [Leptospira levettii]MCW7514228.1 WG repeat-containing protein [Leptospira levettii]